MSHACTAFVCHHLSHIHLCRGIINALQGHCMQLWHDVIINRELALVTHGMSQLTVQPLKPMIISDVQHEDRCP